MLAPASDTIEVTARGEREAERDGAAGGGHDRRADAAEAQRERLDAVAAADGHDQVAPVGGGGDLRGARGAGGQRGGAAGAELARAVEVERGDVRRAGRVEDVDAAAVDVDGVRRDAAGRLAVDERQVAATADAERRDVVGAGVDGDQEAAVVGERDRALGAEAGAGAQAAGAVGGDDRQGAALVPVEPVHGVAGGAFVWV